MGASKLYKDKIEMGFQCLILTRTRSLRPECEVKIVISLQNLQDAAATCTTLCSHSVNPMNNIERDVNLCRTSHTSVTLVHSPIIGPPMAS